MLIEKPKFVLPPWAFFIVVVVGSLLIFSLPFFSKKTSSKPASISNDLSNGSPNGTSLNLSSPHLTPEPKKTEDFPQTEVPLDREVASSNTSAVNQADHSPVFSKNNSPAVVTSFYGDVKVIGPNGEEKMQKNRQIFEGETIEIGAVGEAVLEIEELYVMRLKPSTKLSQIASKQDRLPSGQERVKYRYKLEQGALLGTTKKRDDKTSLLELVIQDKVFNVQDSTFRVQMNDALPWIGVVRGSITAGTENISSNNPLVIHALEKASLLKNATETVPLQVSESEWGLLRETYEMNAKTTKEEAMQVDLSKRTGDFFGYAFDHGSFYTENVGYAVRDFYEDKLAGYVYLETEYDVFPSNSYSGIYVFTRNLDVQNYGGIRFDIRRKPDEGYPDRFYLEIKSKGQIIHRFEIIDIKPEWKTRQINFFSPISTPITEVTLLFQNQTIGKSKKGFIQMRNIQLIPLTADQMTARDESRKNPPQKKAPRILTQGLSSRRQESWRPVGKLKPALEADEEVVVKYKEDSTKKIAEETLKVVDMADLAE